MPRPCSQAQPQGTLLRLRPRPGPATELSAGPRYRPARVPPPAAELRPERGGRDHSTRGPGRPARGARGLPQLLGEGGKGRRVTGRPARGRAGTNRPRPTELRTYRPPTRTATNNVTSGGRQRTLRARSPGPAQRRPLARARGRLRLCVPRKASASSGARAPLHDGKRSCAAALPTAAILRARQVPGGCAAGEGRPPSPASAVL